MASLIKVLLVFTLIIFLLKKKWNLGIIMLGASVLLGLLFTLSPLAILQTMGWAAISPGTLDIILGLVLIMILEHLMRTTGLLQGMVTGLRGLIRDYRLIAAMLPAFLGFLPSAGGAVFSAPMVDEVSREAGLTAEQKSFINYWYRHIWEFILPLYPAVLLTVEIAKVPVGEFMKLQYPFFFFMILLGIPTAFGRATKTVNPVNEEKRKFYLRNVMAGILPVAVIIAAVLFFAVPISLAVGVVVVAMLVWQRYSPADAVKLVRESFSWNIIFLVLGVMIFKDMLTASGAVGGLSAYFQELHIPPVLLAVFLPFMVGALTGMSQAFVAITFPLLLGMVPGGLHLLSLGYISGFVGIMLSPVHLCLVLTVDYFKADFAAVYRRLLLPQMGLILSALLISQLRI